MRRDCEAQETSQPLTLSPCSLSIGTLVASNTLHKPFASYAPGAHPTLAGYLQCAYTVITMATKTRIVRIGNSQGIRIPKTLLDEADLPEDVELHAEPGKLVVRAARHPRSGWATAAKRMHTAGDDRLVDEITPTTFDREEWEW